MQLSQQSTQNIKTMRLKRIHSIYLSLTAVVLLSFSCKPDPTDTIPAFDKSELLNNIANNIIVPALTDFEADLNSLESSFITFQANPTQTNLDLVKEEWKAAYVQWQMVKIFDFGPIRNNGFKGSTGTYPTDSTQVNTNITNGSYVLGSVDNVDAIGFSALDYLLYRTNAFTDLTTNTNYSQYTLDVIQKMKSEFATVNAQWVSYKSTFIASTGTETTSAFSLLVNEFNRDYELAKNAKLGIPLGKQSLDIQLPEYIEARHSGISLELLQENMRALRIVYLGDNTSSGQGFYNYLIQLERSTLAENINSRFGQIINKIETFNGSLEEEMAVNVSELNTLYSLIEGQVIDIKTDMTSAFGVLITYQDNDGD